MSLWREVSRGARVLANRDRADREITEELRHFVEQSVAERVARGWSVTEASRAAIHELGNMTVARERARSYGWENFVGTVVSDLRYAARRLRHSPGFTSVAVLTLALGIGASTAIFSAVNPILFESLPYPRANHIAMISDATADGQPLEVTFGSYLEIARRNRAFSYMAPLDAWGPAIVGDGSPERLAGQRVGAQYFRALGVAPALGRDFTNEDDRANGPRVVILSNALWKRRFSGDRSIVGRTIRLTDTEYLVIGVMPATYENVLAPLAELWTPLQYNLVFGEQSREWGHHLRVVARLRDGVNVAEARRELDGIARVPVPEFARVPWASLGNGMIVTSLQADVTHAVRPALLAVLAAVVLLLAIASVNVTNLMLARGAQRRGEFSMRAALGAAKQRLVRQVLTESVALALVGGALGMVVAYFGVRAIVALSPPSLPRLGAIRLDGAVFAFAFALTTLIGVAVGLLPALSMADRDLHSGAQESSSRTTGTHARTRGVLVVAEVALALVLLVSAGLLFKSISRVFAVPVGFEAAHLTTMQVQAAGREFQSDSTTDPRVDSARYRFFSEALDAVRRVPGVTAASFTSLVPLSGATDTYGVHFESTVDPAADGAALRYAVLPGYFEAMHIPLKTGRLLDARDGPSAPRAVLINESFAKRQFRADEAIGKRLRFGPADGDWYTIVGVVGDVKQSSLATEQPDAVYVPPTQWHWVDNVMTLVVRSRGDAAAFTPAIRGAIWSVNKDQPITRVATMRELVDRSVSDRHFALILFEAFGLSALVLAAVGLYGVLSGSVTERVREIGVRAALGASQLDIVRMVLRRGLALTAVGMGVGLVAAGLGSRVVSSLLFGVSRLDPMTYAVVVALLGVVSGIACALPALRAARVDPASTLKAM